MALENISSSIQQINPQSIFVDGYELSNQSNIPSDLYSGSFTPGLNNIEFYVYSQGIVQYSDYNFTNYRITTNSDPNITAQGKTLGTVVTGSTTNTVNLTPEEDVYNAGFTNGNLTAVYNFVNLELSSSIDNPYYLAEISSDRTEIRLKSNFISNDELNTAFILFEQELKEANYFDEFYVSFGDNEYHIGVNTKLDIPQEEVVDGTPTQYSILIKLYDALPGNYSVGDQLYVLTKTGETQAFDIQFEENIQIPDDTIKLQGPNINVKIKDFINNSTTYKNESELIGTQSTASKDQLLNVLDQKGIKLTPNYSTASFNEFVNFSSAKSRVNNFITKVKNIEAYEADIATINAITSSNPNATEISESIASLYTKIQNEIKSFDGFEYYQYYNTGSDTYPKTGSSFPRELLPTTDTEVLTWLGSDDEFNQYYGGTLLSASLYDDDNPNWLYYTIPTFITEQNDNDNYVEFSNMVGQAFDELWLYTKAITSKLNTTNQLDKGVPLSLADDVITSLGYTGYGNNYNNQDNFIGLIGNDDGDFLPSTGSELITQYIAINSGSIENYWHPEYSFEGYVEQLVNNGFPYPIDKVSKEIYKRLYHNMAYLVKKKGTVAGLRQLITIWGIPSTILRINEFGGKNKDQTDDYDLWYQRYSYAFTPVANSNQASASAVVPWMPLYRNYIAEDKYIVPDGVGLRFKTFGYPSSSYGAGSYATQSIMAKKSNGTDDNEMDWAVVLNYTGSASGSYSGSSYSNYRDWGELRLHVSGTVADGGNAISDPIYLPFFNEGWWTILVQRNQHITASNDENNSRVTYTLYAKNSIYNGNDGNSIGFEGSTSISTFDVSDGAEYGTDNYGTGIYGASISESINYAWNKFGTSKLDGIYVGGRLTGSAVGGYITNTDGRGFSGSFQEFRYYSHNISESVFNDFVMNPESIEGNTITGSESSFDIVNFRAPLGNELEHIFTASATTVYEEFISSSHPAITGSAPSVITASFINPNSSNTLTSSYYIQYQDNTVKRTYSKTNVETYFLDQPSIGIRNRISNKIQATSNLNFGNVLSQYVSIQTDPFISQSYTENINALEVAFSPQDEVNDDIIQSLGYGAVQEAIADPRFRSSSADTYPQLTKIADDYFKKYKSNDVTAYMRLIKYFDDSLFKAIKNYVPARTSVSTGIVIKQNMLERNRYREPQMDIVTTQSYAIQNNPITSKNLELTGSIELHEITGSTGGSFNKYNVTGSQSGFYGFRKIGTNKTVPAGGYLNLNTQLGTLVIENITASGNLYGENDDFAFGINPIINYLQTNQPVEAAFSFNVETTALTSLDLIISSSERGELFRNQVSGGGDMTVYTPILDIVPGEKIGFFVFNSGNNISTVDLTDYTVKTYDYINPESAIALVPIGDISGSANPSTQSFIEYNPTEVGLLAVVNNAQEQFYDGELSGSVIDTYVTQSNPYKNTPPSSSFVYSQPRTLFTASRAGDGSTSTEGYFSNIGNDSFDFDSLISASTLTQGTFRNMTDVSLFPYQTYEVTYTLSQSDFPSGQNSGSGLSSFLSQNDSSDISDMFFASNTGFYDANDSSGNDYWNAQINSGFRKLSPTATPTQMSSRIASPGVFNVTYSFALKPPKFNWNNLNYSYSLNFHILGGYKGRLSDFKVRGVGGIYEEVQAPIEWNLNVLSSSFDIWNTQSIILDNSFYNPINNNVEVQTTSSHRYLLSYNDEQYCPENTASIIDIMYADPLYTGSATKATVPDSNYTEAAHKNPRYDGTKIKSLDYNKFTPSGSVRPLNTLKPAPYNKGRANISSSVADQFLDGSTGSWEGDKSYGNTAVANKHPQYIAHFNRSFEQLSYYNSREFVIDSLISISMENLNGAQVEPISIDIDGSNKNKKFVSSIFEPDRKVGVSYTALNSQNQTQLNLESLSTGNSDLLGGGIEFLTINSNAKNRSIISNKYNYKLGDGTLAEVVFTGNLTGSVFNVEEGGITTSGSYFQQGTLGINADVDSLNQNTWSGGKIYPIVSSGVITEVRFSASGENFRPGDIITITTSSMAVYGYTSGVPAGSDPVALRIVLPEKNVQYPGTVNIDQSPTAVQMVTASNIINGEQTFGFLLSGSNTTGSDSTFLIDFSQVYDKDGSSALPDGNRLSLGGPQLAVFHAYNKLVERQQVRGDFDPGNSNYPTTNSESIMFIRDGINPSDPDNYWTWQPSSSDCPYYEAVNEPFLINRGDVIRVEGTRVTPITGQIASQSLAFVEDFTVQEIQDYTFTSSVFNPTAGDTIISSSFTSQQCSDNDYTVAAGSPSTHLFVQANGDFSTNGSGTGASILVTSQEVRGGGVGNNALGLNNNSFIIATGAGSGFEIGDRITFTSTQIQSFFGFTSNSDSITLTLAASNIVPPGGYPNDFTVTVQYNDDEYADYAAYQQFDEGEMGLTIPVFLNVTPNPQDVLNGIDGGAITKFTIRRQLENDSKVVIKNQPPPPNSLGTLTQTRGGFLIPDDLSETQKNNALNIINQLRQKNAFPGDTASSTEADDSSTTSS